MLHRGYLTASGWRYIDSIIIYIIGSHIETRRPTLNISLPDFVLLLKLSTLLIARIADLTSKLTRPSPAKPQCQSLGITPGSYHKTTRHPSPHRHRHDQHRPPSQRSARPHRQALSASRLWPLHHMHHRGLTTLLSPKQTLNPTTTLPVISGMSLSQAEPVESESWRRSPVAGFSPIIQGTAPKAVAPSRKASLRCRSPLMEMTGLRTWHISTQELCSRTFSPT